MKAYVVLRDKIPEAIFLDKFAAHRWAEDKYGSRSDGICVEGVVVEAFKLVPIDS